MRILAFDVESTGLDTSRDRIIEIGYLIWDGETQKEYCHHSQMVWGAEYPPLSQDIIELTGITNEDIREFGKAPNLVLQELDELCQKFRIEYFMAHSGSGFDRSLLLAEIQRQGLKTHTLTTLPWIDTCDDIPYPKKYKLRGLTYASVDFPNPKGRNAHRALGDVQLMVGVANYFGLEKILAYKKKPFIFIRALVPHPKTDGGIGKDRAKKLGYRWQELYGRTYPFSWVKRIKEDELISENEQLGYPITTLGV